SASIMCAPNSARHCAAVDFPEAIPPVRPITLIDSPHSARERRYTLRVSILFLYEVTSKRSNREETAQKWCRNAALESQIQGGGPRTARLERCRCRYSPVSCPRGVSPSNDGRSGRG